MESTPIKPGVRLKSECHLCGFETAETMPFGYAFKNRFLQGVRCPRCAMVYIHPQPSAAEIEAMYAEEYFTEHSETVGAHGTDAYMESAQRSEGERKKSAAKLDRLLRAHLPERGRLIEVGCGPGFLLDEFRNLGWKVQGVEISEFAARFAREKLGLDVIVAQLAAETYPEGSADAVFMGDVLEHLARPRQELEAISRWIRPGGVMLVAVPSTLNLLSAKLGMAYYAVRSRPKVLRIPPYHLFEYTPSTIKRMLESVGFKRIQVKQSAVPLKKMGLRGSSMENAGKVLLQIPAHVTSRLFNCGGDRLMAVAHM